MIDVVIPVYKGLLETRRCLESVLGNAQRARFEIVVVDDASQDRELVAYVDRLSSDGRVTVLRNEANRGFVYSANRAMALHSDRDVVLLNSDTEIAGDWLDRILRAAGSASDIGTVTPFSNNATICSYPFHGWKGGVPGQLGLAALDGLFARTNAGRTVDLPTAVGFCMYIRRACIDDVGAFDLERFGRGYGEENDFSLRAAGAGWRSVLAGDVFVFHEGAVSFGDERHARAGMAEERLLEIHPSYMEKVSAFIAADPARDLRAAVDRARLQCGAVEAMCVVEEHDLARAAVVARLDEVEALAREQASVIAQLRRGLAHAEELVAGHVSALAETRAERDRVIREREAETAKLRTEAGRSEWVASRHAEELAQLREELDRAEARALGRAEELDRIRGSRWWRYYAFMMRHF